MAASSTCAKVVSKPRPSRLSTHGAKADTVAVIVAGGIGERFGYPDGKQFITVCGLPLMSWSILAFDHAPSVAHIVIACSDEKRAAVQRGCFGQACTPQTPFILQRLVLPGRNRFTTRSR